MPAATSFGETLKRYRHAAGLTQEALAEAAGYSTVYVSMLERGKRQPLEATAQVLARALGLKPSDAALLKSSIEHAANGTHLLVGRSTELRSLDRHMRGQGPIAWIVTGEPGIGKTRLLREAAERSRESGWKVLSGRCYRRGGEDPYAPIASAVRGYNARIPESELRDTLRGAEWLAVLVPELRDFVDRSILSMHLEEGHERGLMVSALRLFLERIGGPAGTLLILDDLHWAGSDGLQLLSQLLLPANLDEPNEFPDVRIVAAYRNTELRAGDQLSATLADLVHAGVIVHHELSPLSEDESRLLLERSMTGGISADKRVKDEVIQRSGGVPFFLISCAQSLGSSGSTVIPWDIRQSLRQRIGELTEGAREILTIACLVGRRVPLALLKELATVSESVISIDELTQSRLLIESGRHDYRVPHDVIREVVEDELTSARRAGLHWRIAQALEASPTAPASTEDLAYHYARTDDDKRAVTYLERAGDDARARYAHVTARGYYRELLDRMQSSGQEQASARAMEKLGTVNVTLGNYDDALQLLEQAADRYARSSDLDGLSRSLAEMGRVHFLQGTPEQGIEKLSALRSRGIGMVSSAGLAQINLSLASLFLARNRFEEQLEAAELAQELAENANDQRLVAAAEVWLGCALNQLGRTREGRQAQEQAIPSLEAAGDLTNLSHALNDIAFNLEMTGELMRSRRYKERALEIAKRGGDPSNIANLMFRCGQNALLSGDWETAKTYFEQAQECLEELRVSALSPYPFFGLALLSLALDDLEECRRLANRCLEVAEQCADEQATRASQGLLAEIDIARGRPDLAVVRLENLPLEQGLSLYSTSTILAEAMAKEGRSEDAADTLESEIVRAGSQGNELRLIEALRVRALLRVGSKPMAALDDAREARDRAARIGSGFYEKRVLRTLSEILGLVGKSEEAEECRARVELLLGSKAFSKQLLSVGAG